MNKALFKLFMLLKFKRQLKEKGELYLRVKARPGAAKTAVKEITDDETVKMDIAAPPVKGKANKELIKFLAQEFAVSKNNVKIISGAASRTKLIKIIYH
ncbi:MAG: DUF167 domain-containing protein [Nitrospirota bacterium]|nr:DUF167 domain-containing protein [Nitrospirota bacterium]